MFIKRHLLAAVVGLSFSYASQASDLTTLINMLHENGMVTDAQYGRLMTEIAENNALKQQEKIVIDEKMALATQPSEVEVSTQGGGLTVQTRDGQFSTKIGGRVQVDAATYGGSPEMADGTDIRRARLYLSGQLYRDWGYRLEYEFDNRSITDAYMTYDGFKNYQIAVGNFKDPFSLDYLISGNNTMFMERALPTAFNAGRHVGVMGSRNSESWTLAAGIFGDTISSTSEQEDEGWGWGSRGTLSPINEAGKLLHFGLAVNYRDLQPSNTVRFSQPAESNVSGLSIIDTTVLNNADTMLKTGLELATVVGAFTAQAEYIRTSIERDTVRDADFDGWYLQSSYFLTGESRPYKNGVLGGIKPNRRVGDGGIGAWEIAIRYSTLNLNDGDINGGEADSMTLGLNWYPVPLLRFSANYVQVLDIDGGLYDGKEPNVFQVRSQWAF